MRKHYIWKCPFCAEEFNNRKDWFKHKREIHNSIRNNPARVLANRSCQFCGYETKYLSSLRCHERYCKLNPNHVEPWKMPVTNAWRERMRNQAIKGYKNGTYHGWMNCHSSKPSYPEKFFMKVIKNHFDDIHYKYNLMFYHYKLDFAWPHKKLCIEIDGSQHERNLQQKISDARKDEKLLNNGWKVLRIRWVDMYHYPQKYIEQAKEFIDSGVVLTCEHYVNPSKIKAPKSNPDKIEVKKHHAHRVHEPNTRRHKKTTQHETKYFRDKTGRGNKYVLDPSIWKTRLNAILESGVDLTKYGWVEQVHTRLGLSRRTIYQTINHFKAEMDGKYFRR